MSSSLPDDINALKRLLAEQEALNRALLEKLNEREREIDHLQACFIFWGKTVQCWQSNSLTKQSVQNDCPCRFRNSFFKGKQHEN